MHEKMRCTLKWIKKWYHGAEIDTLEMCTKQKPKPSYLYLNRTKTDTHTHSCTRVSVVGHYYTLREAARIKITYEHKLVIRCEFAGDKLFTISHSFIFNSFIIYQRRTMPRWFVCVASHIHICARHQCKVKHLSIAPLFENDSNSACVCECLCCFFVTSQTEIKFNSA